jgi:hypothetical protein
MLQKGMHPTIIAEAFLKASAKAVEYLTEMSAPVDLKDNASLLRAASTSLNSKVAPFVSYRPTQILLCFFRRSSLNTLPHWPPLL